MRALRPGDDVSIGPGLYRESVLVPELDWGNASTRIHARSARTVTVKGSDEISGWSNAGQGVYWVNWSGDEPEQVFRAGASLKQIGGTVFDGYPLDPANPLAHVHEGEGGIWLGRIPGGVSELVAESFTYDKSSHRLYVKTTSPVQSGQVLEVSVRRQALQAENATGLTVEGLDFAHSNTSLVARWGAVKISGRNNLLNDLVVSDMDAVCVQIAGIDSALKNSVIQRCGQSGVSGSGTRLTISDNRITYANVRGFNKWWEAGGMKLISGTGLHESVISRNVVAFCEADGIWVDWKNTNNLIEGNTTAYNSGFGIQYEASQTGIIRANLSYGNGLRGIYLLESSDTLIDGNAVFGNALEGIGVVDGGRSAADATLRPTGNRVTNNSIGWNDFNRNWVQLVLPGPGYGSISDGNSLKAERLLPRASMGFVSASNPAYASLSSWRAATQLDVHSMEQMMAMPPTLQAALAARRLIEAAELPAFLARPGNF